MYHVQYVRVYIYDHDNWNLTKYKPIAILYLNSEGTHKKLIFTSFYICPSRNEQEFQLFIMRKVLNLNR